MKKILFGDKGNFYKANLHCHSTLSDGKMTVEQIKEEYMKRGYSVIAYTDHEYMVDHSDLTDENFLAITGYEVAFDTRRPGPGHDDYKFVTTYHMNFYKKVPGDTTHIYWNPNNCWCGDKEYQKTIKYVGPIVDKKYDIDFINGMVKTAHENNFLVSYNHPVWSGQTRDDYAGLKDVDFLEIYNHGCYVVGYDEYVPHIFDEMLRMGKKIYCTCTDDNHNWVPLDAWDNDSFGGYVVINAPELKYETIISALEKGDFYASTGASINEISFEDGYITVKCDGAKRVTYCTGTRSAGLKVSTSPEEPVTEATFYIAKDDDFVRIEVEDFNGKKAHSQAFYTEELYK